MKLLQDGGTFQEVSSCCPNLRRLEIHVSIGARTNRLACHLPELERMKIWGLVKHRSVSFEDFAHLSRLKLNVKQVIVPSTMRFPKCLRRLEIVPMKHDVQVEAVKLELPEKLATFHLGTELAHFQFVLPPHLQALKLDGYCAITRLPETLRICFLPPDFNDAHLLPLPKSLEYYEIEGSDIPKINRIRAKWSPRFTKLL